MAATRVYNVNTGPGISDLGTTVLPANIKPFDFSALDNALKAEADISNKTLDTVMANVNELGNIKDELTGIPTPNAFHKNEVSAAIKAQGLDEASLKQAVGNLDNPLALYDIHRKKVRLAYNPAVKSAMYDQAILDNYKANLPKITDPGLRALAIDDLNSAINDPLKSKDPNAIKNLNLDQYKSVDLEGAYIEALNHFAPPITTDAQVYGPDGSQHTVRTTKRDPAMVAKTREYFKDNPIIKNNLIASGYWDKDTDKQTGTWFDDLEKSQSAETSQILNVKGATGQSKSGTTSDYSYNQSGSLPQIKYTPDEYTIGDTGATVDLGVIAARETAGRAPENLVHVDPSGNALNISAYSFNGGNGKDFLKRIKGTGAALGLDKEIEDLESMSFDDTSEANLAKVSAAYAKLDKAMGGDLASLERDYAAEKFITPAIESAKKILDKDLTKGEATLIADIAIQWRENTWKRWLKEYDKDESGTSLTTFLTRKRIEQAGSNTNVAQNTYLGQKVKNAQALVDSMNNQALQVLDAVTGIDGGRSTQSIGAALGNPPTANAPVQYAPVSDYYPAVTTNDTTAVNTSIATPPPSQPTPPVSKSVLPPAVKLPSDNSTGLPPEKPPVIESKPYKRGFGVTDESAHSMKLAPNSKQVHDATLDKIFKLHHRADMVLALDQAEKDGIISKQEAKELIADINKQLE